MATQQSNYTERERERERERGGEREREREGERPASKGAQSATAAAGDGGWGSGGWQQKLKTDHGGLEGGGVESSILTLAEDAAATPIIAMAATADNRKQADIYFNE